MRKLNLKIWALCSMAFALAACSDEDTASTSQNAPAQSFLTTRLNVKSSDQSRANSVDTWTENHGEDAWKAGLQFTTPADATDCTNSNFDRNAKVLVIPATATGTISLGWANLSDGAAIYVEGNIESITDFNANGTVSLYVCEDASLKFGPTNGNWNVYNSGNLTLNSFNNINNVYNNGYLNFDEGNQWWTPEKNDIPNKMNIYSAGGVVNFAKSTDLKANLDIHNTVYATGDLKIQNTEAQYVCAIEIDGNLDVTDGHLKTAYIKANEIKFDGAEIYLFPKAYIEANKISMPNSFSAIHGYEGSTALVEAANEFYFRNYNNFESAFSGNIYFKTAGKIDIEERLTRENGQVDNVSTTYNSVADYIASQNGQAVADRFTNSDNKGVRGCKSYGPNTPEEPGTPDEPTGPKLVEIGSIDAPDHDHDADKGNPNRPHLSATCIDYKDGTFYVSYHMRGGFQSGEHYGGDTFDKDGVEGCIETWTLADNELNSTEIKLGHYMWTNAFDFNHLILDGNNIVTVGHLADKGAIIGKLPNPFTNVNADANNVDTWSAEFSYKYLTTDEPLMDGSVRIDYKNAGDGNCVIKNGNEYFVATYAGYGKLDSEFNRIKDAAGNVAFVSTPGSAKHLIEKDGDIAVLYLDSRPETTATATSTATVATISAGAYPFGGTTTALPSFVQPIDGKNVLAWNGTNLYACLGKGGLSVNGEVYSFGAEGKEPVNGVATDDEYVYVASGSHLRVLDVTTNEEVAKVAIPYMSANYIKVATVNGEKYIAVAFGQAGIKVYRFEK